MMKSIWEDTVNFFYRSGSELARLIFFISIYFVVISIFRILIPDFYNKIVISNELIDLGKYPWKPFTSLFATASLFSLIFNMFWLYWMGRIVSDLISKKRILALYVLGGLFSIFFFLLMNGFQSFIRGEIPTVYASAMGGGIMAITIAAGLLAPDYRIRMILFETRLKYIVLVFLGIHILASLSPTLGLTHYIYLGGAIFGWLFIYMLRNGRDMSEPFNFIVERFSNFFKILGGQNPNRKEEPVMVYDNKEKQRKSKSKIRKIHYEPQDLEEKVNIILDKINAKGIDSLTQEEKDILNEYRNKFH